MSLPGRGATALSAGTSIRSTGRRRRRPPKTPSTTQRWRAPPERCRRLRSPLGEGRPLPVVAIVVYLVARSLASCAVLSPDRATRVWSNSGDKADLSSPGGFASDDPGASARRVLERLLNAWSCSPMAGGASGLHQPVWAHSAAGYVVVHYAQDRRGSIVLGTWNPALFDEDLRTGITRAEYQRSAGPAGAPRQIPHRARPAPGVALAAVSRAEARPLGPAPAHRPTAPPTARAAALTIGRKAGALTPFQVVDAPVPVRRARISPTVRSRPSGSGSGRCAWMW